MPVIGPVIYEGIGVQGLGQVPTEGQGKIFPSGFNRSSMVEASVVREQSFVNSLAQVLCD